MPSSDLRRAKTTKTWLTFGFVVAQRLPKKEPR
jgi:hypothetical protein